MNLDETQFNPPHRVTIMLMTVPAVGGTKGKRQVPCPVVKWAQGPEDLATNPDLVIWEMWL